MKAMVDRLYHNRITASLVSTVQYLPWLMFELICIKDIAHEEPLRLAD